MQPEDYQKIEQDLQNQLLSKKQQEQRHQQGQQRVDSWNFNFDSCLSNDILSHSPSGAECDSIVGEGEEETFYSMSSVHDVLPPLEEPVLPADMLGINRSLSGNLLQSPEFSPLGSLQSSPYNFMNTVACDKRFVSPKIQPQGKPWDYYDHDTTFMRMVRCLPHLPRTFHWKCCSQLKVLRFFSGHQ